MKHLIFALILACTCTYTAQAGWGDFAKALGEAMVEDGDESGSAKVTTHSAIVNVRVKGDSRAEALAAAYRKAARVAVQEYIGYDYTKRHREQIEASLRSFSKRDCLDSEITNEWKKKGKYVIELKVEVRRKRLMDYFENTMPKVYAKLRDAGR